MRLRFLASLVALLVVLSFRSPSVAAAAPGDLSGAVPSGGGLALVVWGGGTAADVRARASADGCDLSAVWYLDGGPQQFIGYVFGAPDVVNAPWDARFGGGVAPNTPLILSCRSPQTIALSTAPSTDQDLSSLIFDGINGERANRGLPPLRASTVLTASAERYAGMLLQAGRLDHELDGTEPWDRAQAAGYPTADVGEVLASRSDYGPFDVQRRAADLVQQWMTSPPHRAILMGENIPFQELGVGCAHSTSGNWVNIYCAGETGIP